MLTVEGKAMDETNLQSYNMKIETGGAVVLDSTVTATGKEVSFTHMAPIPAAGSFTLTVTAKDAAGNTSTPETRNIETKCGSLLPRRHARFSV